MNRAHPPFVLQQKDRWALNVPKIGHYIQEDNFFTHIIYKVFQTEPMLPRIGSVTSVELKAFWLDWQQSATSKFHRSIYTWHLRYLQHTLC